MKPLSLDEINSTDNVGAMGQIYLTKERYARLLFTAREYHRLREALEQSCQCDRWPYPDGGICAACETLKESEGE